MRAFLKRLGWYLVGFSIGLVFLGFIINKKSDGEGIEFCYFPNCRVLKDIRSKPIVVMQEDTKDTLGFMDLKAPLQDVLTNGNIDFGKSDTKAKPCKTYWVSLKSKNIMVNVRNCKDYAFVTRVDESL
ncbi:MAG: DUF4258 domain-containing protein [Bacteroidota bacterium]